MHTFGIALLFGIGIMSVARWVEQPLAWVRSKLRISVFPLLEVALGVGLAWAINFNLWQLWNIPMRADWLAVTLTGAILGGIAEVFSEVLGLFTGLGRKLNDEAETIERPSGLQRVA